MIIVLISFMGSTVDLPRLNPYCTSNDPSVVSKTSFVRTFIIFSNRFPTVLSVKYHTNPITPGGFSLFGNTINLPLFHVNGHNVLGL